MSLPKLRIDINNSAIPTTELKTQIIKKYIILVIGIFLTLIFRIVDTTTISNESNNLKKYFQFLAILRNEMKLINKLLNITILVYFKY